jgi:hypothetical protein
MPSIINASTSGAGGVITTADASGQLELQTAGTTAVTVTSSQNVGIGTTSPASKLDIVAQNGLQITGFQPFYTLRDTNDINKGFRLQTASGNTLFSNDATGGGTYTERMRIDSSGNLLVGTTSIGGVGGITMRPNLGGAGTYSRITINHSVAGSSDVFSFEYNGTQVGRINIGTASTAYVTTSDYRLKENAQPITGALDKVVALKPVIYTWKADGSFGQGFIAHELQAVVPECVFGEKDAINEDGSIKPQGIDTSFLVATLTAAIQEQQAIITDLKARIEVLEGALA